MVGPVVKAKLFPEMKASTDISEEYLLAIVERAPKKGEWLRVHILHESYKTLGRYIRSLDVAFYNAPVISAKLKETIQAQLTACEQVLALMTEEMLRLEASNAHNINFRLLKHYHDVVNAYIGLVMSFLLILSSRDEKRQDYCIDFGNRHISKNIGQLNHKILFADGILFRAGESKVQPLDLSASISAEKKSSTSIVATTSLVFKESEPKAENVGLFGYFFNGFLWALWAVIRPRPRAVILDLFKIISNGNIAFVSLLVKECGDIDVFNAEGYTMLQCAIHNSKTYVARHLLENGADWQSKFNTWAPPLFYAASIGSCHVAYTILEWDADVNAVDSSGEQYFVGVVDRGNCEGVKFLLENGANPNAQALNGQTVIARSISRGDESMVSVLLKAGADPNTVHKRNDSDMQPSRSRNVSILSYACELEYTGIPRMLIQYGADTNVASMHGDSILADALYSDKYALAKDLLEGGADADVRNRDKHHVLVLMIQNVKLSDFNKARFVQCLLQSGADADAYDQFLGLHALGHALRLTSKRPAEILLQHGASPEVEMIRALVNLDVPVVRLLGMFSGREQKKAAMKAAERQYPAVKLEYIGKLGFEDWTL